jgi:hypothetical protein
MADLSDDIRSLVQGGITPVTFEEISSRPHGRHGGRRRTVARVASVAVLAAVAVPVVLALGTGRTMTAKNAHDHRGLARHRVTAALDTTIASGSFNIAFSQQALTAPTTPTTTTTTECPPPAISGSMPNSSISDSAGTVVIEQPTTGMLCYPVEEGPGLAISGQGTIDTNPFAMVVETNVPGFGQITLRDDGTNVWELGGGNYGLSPGSGVSGPGSSLPGFAGLVEGTLGAREGATDMMVLANPTGYLELDENAISSADQVGTDTVDGVPVTVYKITLDPAQEATVAGANADEASAIQSALAVLKQEGYTGTTVDIAIDGGGYIRRTTSTAMFSDGSSQTSTTTFSDFGCAGTVLMPGQTGSSSPPAGCVSPDTSGSSSSAPPQPTTGTAGT